MLRVRPTQIFFPDFRDKIKVKGFKVKVVGLRAPHRAYFSYGRKVGKRPLKGAYAPLRIP